MSNLIKRCYQRLNVQLATGDEATYKAWRDNCKVSRNPPVSPATFQVQIDTRIFTDGHTDKKIVVQLYASTFATLAASAEKLEYAHLLWSQAAQATVLSIALPQFALDVSWNPFGAQGVVKLTGGMAEMPVLRTLIMRSCRGLAVEAYIPTWSANVAHVQTLELFDVSGNTFECSSLPALAKHIRCPFKIDSSLRDLTDGGFSAGQLKDSGYKGRDLKNVGFSAAQLKGGGFTAFDLNNVRFTAGELRHGGFSAEELKNCGLNAAQLKEAGFDAGQLVAAGFRGRELASLFDFSQVSASDFKQFGFSAEQLKDLGFSARRLREVGFTAGQLAAAGFGFSDMYSLFELSKSSASDVKQFGFSARQLKDFLVQCKTAEGGRVHCRTAGRRWIRFQ